LSLYLSFSFMYTNIFHSLINSNAKSQSES
jgi:hypothetical protein